MTVPTGRARGRPRDTEADAAILRAALDLFIERGVEGTSIEQVAKRAGVGKLTVYRRWSSKEDLIAAAVESMMVAPPVPSEQLADIPLAELLQAVIPEAAAALVQPRFRATIARLIGTSSSHPAIMEASWTHYIEPRRAATRPLLERARADGLIPTDTDLEVVMDMMVGAVIYRLAQPGPLDAPTMRRYLEAVYTQVGLMPRA